MSRPDNTPKPENEYRASILLVDDEPMVLKMLQTFLTAQGFKVLCASDARSAITIIEQQKQVIDLLITDIRMPDMHGIQLLEAVRQLHPGLPVLLMTGYTDFELVVEGLKQHAFDLLFKPIDFEQLNWCISKALAFKMTQQIEQRYKKRLEEQVAKQTALLCKQLEELHEAQRKAAEVDELKRSFLSLISHEFRTPLNGILGTVELLEEAESPASQLELLAMLKLSAQRMGSLVSNLLTLAEARAVNPENNDGANSPCTVFAEIEKRYQQRAREKGINITTSCSAPHDIILYGPWDAFQIIAATLLDNALKFTRIGDSVGCTVWIERAESGSDSAELFLKICDNGPGIELRKQELIFQPFTQADHYLTRQAEGAGIGLAIVRTLVDKTGGNITLESSPGNGSCFTCRLPFMVGRSGGTL